MLKQHFAIVNLIRASLDFLTIGVLWNAVYFSRFHSGLFSHSGIPSYTKHLLLTFPVVVIFYLCRRWSGIALSGQLFRGANRWAPDPAPPRPSLMR